MIEKSFTIKDIIIYLIPGILNTFFIFLFFKLKNPEIIDFTTMDTKYSIVTIVLAFLIGFIFSQIQIILSNKILKSTYRKLRTLEESIEIEEFKIVMCREIKKVFELNNLSNDDLLKNDQIFFFCYNFILEKGNNKSIELINRAKNLASFATSLYIPVVLMLINSFLYFENNCKLIMISILVSFIFFYSLRKITINFRGEFYKNTFRVFYLANNNS
ncbi:hypothetical protein [Wenyingzhuangia sp. IMCC45467]